ncbi:MAG: hypothetical protein ACRDAU_15820 [Clostridium sp.]
MKFIEEYLEKCLKNKGFHWKTSIIAGGIIGLVFFLVNLFSGIVFDVAMVIFIAMTISFSLIWYIIINRLHKTFRKQIVIEGKDSEEERKTKRENARRLMEKRNSKKKSAR